VVGCSTAGVAKKVWNNRWSAREITAKVMGRLGLSRKLTVCLVDLSLLGPVSCRMWKPIVLIAGGLELECTRERLQGCEGDSQPHLLQVGTMSDRG
jgi:hypothetical protein